MSFRFDQSTMKALRSARQLSNEIEEIEKLTVAIGNNDVAEVEEIIRGINHELTKEFEEIIHSRLIPQVENLLSQHKDPTLAGEQQKILIALITLVAGKDHVNESKAIPEAEKHRVNKKTFSKYCTNCTTISRDYESIAIRLLEYVPDSSIYTFLAVEDGNFEDGGLYMYGTAPMHWAIRTGKYQLVDKMLARLSKAPFPDGVKSIEQWLEEQKNTNRSVLDEAKMFSQREPHEFKHGKDRALYTKEETQKLDLKRFSQMFYRYGVNLYKNPDDSGPLNDEKSHESQIDNKPNSIRYVTQVIENTRPPTIAQIRKAAMLGGSGAVSASIGATVVMLLNDAVFVSSIMGLFASTPPGLIALIAVAAVAVIFLLGAGLTYGAVKAYHFFKAADSAVTVEESPPSSGTDGISLSSVSQIPL